MNPPRIGEERRERAREHWRACLLCEHRCGADRASGERGPCKAGAVARVFKHRVEFGEERELIPSHLFYLSGCDLRCAFCIAGVNAFDPRRGRPLTPEFFREAVAQGRAQGARTLQWVGGEPTIHLPAILEAMAGCPDLPPIVWKSDFHGTPEAFALLEGVVDVYLADFKFGDDALRPADRGGRRLPADRDPEPRHGRAAGRPDRPPPAPARPFRLLLPADRRLAAGEPARTSSSASATATCRAGRPHRHAELARPLDRDAGRPGARPGRSRSGLRIVE